MGVNAQTPASAQTFADRTDPYVEAGRLRDELAQTRQMLADAQRLTKTGSWIIDPVGGGASGSVECYRILGIPGKTSSAHFMECLSNVHADDLPAVLEGFQQSIVTGESRPLHYRIVAADGSTTDIETVAQPVCDEAGQVVSVIGTVMDVTARNRVQEALRASEKLARGQLGALTRTLDALVQEASPDRLMEVVLRTIARQFDASTITVWLTDDGNARARFAFQFLNDRLFTVADAAHPAARMSADAQNVVPMLIAGEVAGLLAISFRERRELHPDEIELAQALANQVMLALQLTRLSDYSRNAAVMAERNRVVRDVHDTLAHAFTGVIVQLEASDDASARGLDAEAGAHIARAEAMARAGLQEARRSVMALRPQVLEGNDLSTALREMVTGMTDGTSVNSEFAQGGVVRALPAAWDEHLLRIGQEALTNAIRHGHARRIVMELYFSENAILLRLTDDGRGFDANSPFEGLGLAGIRARVASMGGQLSIESEAGSGTTISVSVPQSTTTAP
jgi:signal transduction histidine kinase